MKLEDGKGTGKLAQVDDNHRLQVVAIASDRAESSNLELEAFVLSTDIHSISAGTEHRIAYLNNGEASRDLIVDLVQMFSDGGSTNYDKPCIVRCYLNASEPNVNEVLKDPIGTNTGAGQSSTDFYTWDSVGTGFTQTAPGDLLTTSILGIGETDNRVPSKIILGPAKTLSWSFECVEAADVAMQIYIHLA